MALKDIYYVVCPFLARLAAEDSYSELNAELKDAVVSVTPIVQDMTARVEWKPRFKNGQD